MGKILRGFKIEEVSPGYYIVSFKLLGLFHMEFVGRFGGK